MPQPLTQVGVDEQRACFRLPLVRDQNPLLDDLDEPVETRGVVDWEGL